MNLTNLKIEKPPAAEPLGDNGACVIPFDSFDVTLPPVPQHVEEVLEQLNLHQSDLLNSSKTTCPLTAIPELPRREIESLGNRSTKASEYFDTLENQLEYKDEHPGFLSYTPRH